MMQHHYILPFRNVSGAPGLAEFQGDVPFNNAEVSLFFDQAAALYFKQWDSVGAATADWNAPKPSYNVYCGGGIGSAVPSPWIPAPMDGVGVFQVYSNAAGRGYVLFRERDMTQTLVHQELCKLNRLMQGR